MSWRRNIIGSQTIWEDNKRYEKENEIAEDKNLKWEVYTTLVDQPYLNLTF